MRESCFSMRSVIALIFLAMVPTIPTNILIEEYYYRLSANNAIFIIALAVLLSIKRDRYLDIITLVFSSFSFVALSGFLGLIGAILAGKSLMLANIVGYPIVSIGYYPRGADAPFEIGVAMWGATSFVIINIGGLIAIGIGYLRKAQT